MGLRDLESVKADFEKKLDATSHKLVALIDKRLASIRRTISGAAFSDSMGSSFLYVEGLRDNSKDPLYLACDLVREDEQPRTEEEYGEPLPQYLKKAKEIYEMHADEIDEVLKIAEFMYDMVHRTYS